MIRYTALCLLCLMTLLSPARATEPVVTVFAAASLRGVLEEAAGRFDAEVSLSFGGSGTMARQIAAGAPADVVILASALWMDWLVEQGRVTKQAPRAVAGNRLSLIAPSGSTPLADIAKLPDRLAQGRLAMGQRDAVPAGSYAQQWLKSAGLWNSVSGQLAETDNVRAALALVARRDVPLGIVYATDAQAEPKVVILYDIPAQSHAPILYPAAALTSQGTRFLDHLLTPEAQGIFAAHGFEPAAP
ncbi:MAG: molybdate ABC transporter substrate-binding protein [Sulfitobacter sp.]